MKEESPSQHELYSFYTYSSNIVSQQHKKVLHFILMKFINRRLQTQTQSHTDISCTSFVFSSRSFASFSTMVSFLVAATALSGLLVTSGAANITSESIRDKIMNEERFVVFNSRRLTGECCTSSHVTTDKTKRPLQQSF